MINILFVCHGNICRSTMAEFVMKELVRRDGYNNSIHIQSAGTENINAGHDTHHGTKQILIKYNIPFTPRQAVQIKAADYDIYDFIVAMDDYNMRRLRTIIPRDPHEKITKLLSFIGSDRDVADPWYTRNFEETYRDILQGCSALKEYIYLNYDIED